MEDVVSAFVAAIKNSSKAKGKSINVGSSESKSVLDILEKVETISGKKLILDKKPDLLGDVKQTLADITLAKELLDWQPNYSFENGLKKTFDWFSSKS